MITVADLVKYRRRTEKLVDRVAEAYLLTEYGEFNVVGYRFDDRRQAPRRAREGRRPGGGGARRGR